MKTRNQEKLFHEGDIHAPSQKPQIGDSSMQKKSSRIFGYISFGVVLYAALNHLEYVIMVGRNAFQLVSPLITGLILAFVLHVPVNLLTSRLERLFKKTKRKPSHKTIEGISLLLTFILIALIVTLAFTITIPNLLRSFRSIYEELSVRLPQWISELERTEWYGYLGLNGRLEKLDIPKLLEPLQGLSVLSFALDFSSSVFSGIILASIEIVMAIYLILSRKELCRSAKRAAYALLPEQSAKWLCHFAGLVNECFSKFFTGQLLESCILGLLIFASLSIFAIPYAGVTAILTAICAFVPYVGAYLSCGIGAILTLLVSPGKVFTCIIVYTITQFIENQFIYPHVVGNSVGLPPILTLAAVVIGDRISGLLGMIFAIPMMAVVYTLAGEGIQKALHDRKIEGLE